MVKAVRLLTALAGALFLALPGVAAGQSEATRSSSEGMQKIKMARMNYQKAQRLFEKKDYGRAREELTVCLERMPTFSAAHLLLAKTLYVQKEYPGALTEVERAKATWADSVALGATLREDRDDELRRRKREQEGRLSELRIELGRTTDLTARRNLEGAIAVAEATVSDIDRQLSEIPAPPEAMPAEYPFFHGNVLLRLQRYDEAAAQYRDALKAQPVYPEATNNLASLYLSARRPDLALEVLNQAEAQGVKVNAELKQAVLQAVGR